MKTNFQFYRKNQIRPSHIELYEIIFEVNIAFHFSFGIRKKYLKLKIGARLDYVVIITTTIDVY